MIGKKNNFIDYFKYLRNHVECLKFKFGYSNTCTAKIKNHPETLKITNVPILDKLMYYLPLTSKNKYDELINYYTDLSNDEDIVINRIKYKNMMNSEFIKNHYPHNAYNEEYFSDDGWGMIYFKDMLVIAIGGMSQIGR